MNGKGWKPEYGMSQEGHDILGFVEALPREARREMAATIEMLCRKQGYLSLHDDLTRVPAGAESSEARLAKVIPLRRTR